MPLCPQITNTPVTVVQNADFTVSSVLPVVLADTEQLADVVVQLDGKTKAYYQTTAPTGDLNEGDIWFDTDDGNKQYYYTGTAWVSVQDTAIAAAQSAATAAQTTANGKNRVYRQTSQPTGGTYAEGDLWFDTDDDNKIYRYTSGSWGTAVTLGNNALASISANKITAGTIDASVITVSNINAGNISTGTLNADRIAGASITGTKIAAGTILASNIATATITATQIAAGTITASNLATGTLSANNITTGTLSASVGLTATTGTIGGFTISSTSIFSSTNLVIESTGNISGGNSQTLFYGFVNIGGGFPTGERLIVTGNSSFVGNIIASNNITAQNDFYYPFPNVSSGTANLRVQAGSTPAGRIVDNGASSQRYKHDIVNLRDVPELDPRKLYDLPVRAFKYNLDYLNANDDRYDVLMPGFIAEEVDQVYPLAADYEPTIGIQTWNDRMLIPAMMALIQDLHKEIQTLKGE
jgi:hypothetical protein